MASQEDIRTYPNRPFIGVGVVVWSGEQVLLVRRGKPPRQGDWSIPGGAQHLGETIIEAAMREVREETGLEIVVTGLLDVIDFIDRDEQSDVRYHYTLVDMMADAVSGTPRPGDDVAEVAWVHPNDIDSYRLWTETSRIIRLAAEKRRD
jgi:8-oxo-dGTP diphosphatase